MYIKVMPQVAPTQNVGNMLRTAKKSSDILESGTSGDNVISEAAAASCEISFRSYCEKAKRHRRGLSTSEGRTGKAHRSRSATPEPESGTDAPVRSRTRLDADGDTHASFRPVFHPCLSCPACKHTPRSFCSTCTFLLACLRLPSIVPPCSHGVYRAAYTSHQHQNSQEVRPVQSIQDAIQRWSSRADCHSSCPRCAIFFADGRKHALDRVKICGQDSRCSIFQMCREDYLNLVSIVRAHGLHESPRVSLAALRCEHGSPAMCCFRHAPETRLPPTQLHMRTAAFAACWIT